MTTPDDREALTDAAWETVGRLLALGLLEDT
jgi:hypothetical protein